MSFFRGFSNTIFARDDGTSWHDLGPALNSENTLHTYAIYMITAVANSDVICFSLTMLNSWLFVNFRVCSAAVADVVADDEKKL